jgi:hypothetical protein
MLPVTLLNISVHRRRMDATPILWLGNGVIWGHKYCQKFVQATSTTLAGATTAANYVEFIFGGRRRCSVGGAGRAVLI